MPRHGRAMHDFFADRARCVETVIDPERVKDFDMMAESLFQPVFKAGDVHRVAFYGFGDIGFRQSFFRLVQGVFLAEWYWSSEMLPHRWEMLVSFPTRIGLSEEILELFCGMCRNGVSCDVFEKGITNALVQFVMRIDQGKNMLGWLRHRVRLACERHLRRMEEVESQRRVTEVTGMEFTSGNMIHFYHEWRNGLLELQAHQNALCGLLSRQEIARNVISELTSTVNALLEAMDTSHREAEGLIRATRWSAEVELDPSARRTVNDEALLIAARFRTVIEDNQRLIDHVVQRRSHRFDIPDALLHSSSAGPRSSPVIGSSSLASQDA